MKLNSKYFDMIRIHKPAEIVHEETTPCAWPDCSESADFPAPASPRSREKRFFCKQHITEHNRNYNFFEGMSDEDADAYRRGTTTGHRPTWALGTRRARGKAQLDWQFHDPLEIMDPTFRSEGTEAAPRGKYVSPGQKRALDLLDLDEKADAKAVRQSYKLLLKRYHPDMNGGERRHEDELNRVIQAYNYLKASGFC
jgi:hypothetical protein